MSAKFQTRFVQVLSYREFTAQMANSVDPDEVAHYELPHLDLHCFQNQQISFFCT